MGSSEEEPVGQAFSLVEWKRNDAKNRMASSEPSGEDDQFQVGGTRSNMSGLDQIETSFKGVISHI